MICQKKSEKDVRNTGEEILLRGKNCGSPGHVQCVGSDRKLCNSETLSEYYEILTALSDTHS